MTVTVLCESKQYKLTGGRWPYLDPPFHSAVVLIDGISGRDVLIKHSQGKLLQGAARLVARVHPERAGEESTVTNLRIEEHAVQYFVRKRVDIRLRGSG